MGDREVRLLILPDPSSLAPIADRLRQRPAFGTRR